MKHRHWYSFAFLALTLSLPASGDVIYSNLLDTAIPLDFTGVTVTLAGGGSINPFFGGVGVANNDLLQPGRTVAGDLGALQNFAVGSTIDTSLLLGTGYGGSQTHLGTTFTAGQEGYIGFKLNGSNYGWMRVVFTGNTSGAVIKDWAYDNSGTAIVTGRVQQSVVLEGAQTVTLSPGSGESFTLGSQITDTGGNVNSVVKTGAGTTTLSGSNTYTGGTTLSAGTLVLSSTSAAGTAGIAVSGGSSVLQISAASPIANTITVSNSAALVNREVAASAVFDVGTSSTLTSSFVSTAYSDTTAKILGGTSSAATTLEMSFSDSSVASNDAIRRSDVFSISGTGSDAYVLQLTASGLAGDSVLGSINGGVWDFAVAGNVGNTALPGQQNYMGSFADFQISFGSVLNSYIGAFGYDSGGTSVWAVVNHGGTFAAIPEPTSALAGLLIAAGLLRRRRVA